MTIDPLNVYLDALFGAEPDGALIEVRSRRNGAGLRTEGFTPASERRALGDSLRAAGRERDVWIGVAPRRPLWSIEKRRQFGGAEAVAHAHALWADVDGRAALEALDGYEPAPSMVVRTSAASVHAYWALWPPVVGAEAEAGNRALMRALGADPASCDAARILRPPETFNHKPERRVDGEPYPVTLERVEYEIYTVVNVVGELPVTAPARQASQGSSSTAPAPGDDPLLAIEPAVYVEVLTAREVGRDGYAQCPFHAGGQERTPSLRAFDNPVDGWSCFGKGCDGRTGGTIIDLGAKLYGIEPRGRGYWEIRRRLERDLAAGLGRLAA